MYQSSYKTIKTLADQIVASAQETGKTPERKIAVRQGLMEGIQRARQEIAAPREKSQQEIMAEYMASLGYDDLASTDLSGGPQNGRQGPRGFSLSADDRELLARTIEAEAGGEGYTGMLATGSVIANRVGDGRFGESFREVILQPGQFSAWNSMTGYASGEGGLDMRNMKPSEEAYRVADQILSGDYESPVGTATHYYNPSVATPAWGRQRGGNWTTIGNHIFGSVR